MDEDIPQVDIIIPTIGRRSLEMAILSGCHQAYRNTRVVVIGDGRQKEAEHNIVRVMRKLYGAIEYHDSDRKYGNGNGPRLWWMKQPDCAPWAKFLDDDDILHPRCVSTMMEQAEAGVAGVMCQMLTVYGPASSEIALRASIRDVGPAPAACATGQMLVRTEAARECSWPHVPHGEATFVSELSARGVLRTVETPLYFYMAYRDNAARYGP